MTPGNLGSSILQMLGVAVHNDPRTGLLDTIDKCRDRYGVRKGSVRI